MSIMGASEVWNMYMNRICLILSTDFQDGIREEHVVVFVIHWCESAMDLHVFPILIPTPTSLSTQSLWVFPVHQALALVSCIQPALVVCFTLDNIHVLMLSSQNIPPSPFPTESKSLFCTSVWQKTLQYCKVIHLQPIKINGKLKIKKKREEHVLKSDTISYML